MVSTTSRLNVLIAVDFNNPIASGVPIVPPHSALSIVNRIKDAMNTPTTTMSGPYI